MTNITILKYAEYITGFTVEGHANYKESGSDIICAGISTITQSTLIGLEYINADMKSGTGNGYAYCKLDKAYYRDSRAQILMKTLELTAKQMVIDYTEYMSVKDKEEN